MNGFIAEKKTEDGRTFWVVRDVKTKLAMAVGDTVHDAVENYERIVAHEKLMKELDVNLDDLTF
ncbi:MAG: hypothetical protein II659_08960 [Bacteroidales bacterium]|nr:hypothetical protein [Bacteroidales bacterium]